MEKRWFAIHYVILPVLNLYMCYISDEVMAILKLDNVLMNQTSWKQQSQSCWDTRFSVDLDRVSCKNHREINMTMLQSLPLLQTKLVSKP